MKLQFTLLLLIMCLVLVSCSDSTNKVDNGNHAGGEIASDFEYAVYRGLIEQIYIPVNSDTFLILGGDGIKHMVIDSETFFNYNYSLDHASEYGPFGRWNEPGSSDLKSAVLPDTYSSFLQRNQQTRTINCTKLALSVPCTSIGRTEAERDEIFTRAQDVVDFDEIYPGSYGIVQLSRIGFDTERNQALVYAGNQFHYHAYYPAYVFLFLREQENFEKSSAWLRHDVWFSHNDDIWYLHDFARLAVGRPSNGVDVEIDDNETVSSTPWAGTWAQVSVNGKRIQSLLYSGEIVEGIPTDQVIDEFGDDPNFDLKLQNAPHGNNTVQDVLIDDVRVDEIISSRDRFINEIIAEGLLGDILIDTSSVYTYTRTLDDIYEGKLLVEDIQPNQHLRPRMFLTTRLRLNSDGTMEADILERMAGLADGGRFDPLLGRIRVGGRRDHLAHIAQVSGNGNYHLSSYRYSFTLETMDYDSTTAELLGNFRPSTLTSSGSWLREGNTLTLVGDNGMTAVFKKIDD